MTAARYSSVSLKSLFARYFATAALLMLTPAGVWAQATSAAPATVAGRTTEARVPPTAPAARATTTPTIDGRLDDAAWAQAPAITAFTQRDPSEGAPASEATEVWIVYDNEAVYIGARLHDRSPVTTRLGRRDMTTASSDWFRVSLDSYHDRRTAYRFDVNPSGVRRDATMTGGSTIGDGDLAWDAVWDAATRTDQDGWTVEMRIPFSQLRFGVSEDQVWGLQLERIIDREQELSMFSFSPKSAQGGIPAFGELRGLRGIRPGRPLELLPYVLSQGRFAKTPTNPLVGDTDFGMNVGLDARYRITSNVTLSATANPDFGQVEVDPAVINLTAFETRFEEKRPFFIEGANSFRFGDRVGGPSAAAASLLYSRRMGRAPQLDISADPKDVPPVTAILGAAKVSGKTTKGWSFGVADALTGEETGRYLGAGNVEQRASVEPGTNYFIARVNRELRRGQSALGGMFTAVTRDLVGDAAVNALRSDAYTGGLDYVHEFASRSWILTGFLAGSRVSGSDKAILATQRSSVRYYQRPDATQARLDTTRTSLDGVAATISLRKTAGRHWITDSWFQTISPGFEINDMGFLLRSDRRAFGQGGSYNQRTPGKILRDWRVQSYINYAQNFDGNSIDYYYWQKLVMTHLNYWQVDLNWWHEPKRTDDRFTRGGPLEMRPANSRYTAILRSDLRKPITGRVEAGTIEDRAGSYVRTLDTSLDIHTSPRWNLSIGPKLTRAFQDAQYVTAVTDPAMTTTSGARYIFAPLKQTELSVVTRLNYTFTPNLSFELYAQPLVSNGDYGAPKEFQKPSGYEFLVYGQDIGTISRNGTKFNVDPDGAGPLQSFSVADRTFTSRSLRGNAVLRWEYRPGSTIYVVWQQDRLNPNLMENFSVGRALGSLLNADSNHTLAVKWTCWLNP